MGLSVEENCLDRFFLGPGSMGPIYGVQVSDDDLLDLFETTDIESAASAFVRALPHPNRIAQIIDGEIRPPFCDGKPDFVRILVFLCWMQVTGLRQQADRNFRDILEGYFNHRFQGLAGLNRLWSSLQEFLETKHSVHLALPSAMPHSRIGRTIRISFPTWRDQRVLAKLHAAIESRYQLNELVIGNRIRNSQTFAGSPISFKYAFEQWDLARLEGDLAAADMPFWRAWRETLQGSSQNELEAIESEYCEIELFSVAPDGRTSPVIDLIAHEDRLRPELWAFVKKGWVFMDDLGLGRFRSNTKPGSPTLLVTAAHLAKFHSSAIRSVRPLRNGWSLVTFINNGMPEQRQTSSVPTSLRWVEGIRVGGALLGRAPLTPALQFTGEIWPEVTVEAASISCIVVDGKLTLPSGSYRGRLTGTLDGIQRSVNLVEQASESDSGSRQILDDQNEFSEDGLLFGTIPTDIPGPSAFWSGERHATNMLLSTICEGLYAKSMRGLAMSTAVGIIARVVRSVADCPSPWTILRALSDAGWFDLTILRHVPARRLLLRPTTVSIMPTDPTRCWIDGPTPDAVQARLAATAVACGGTFESVGAIGEWGLPRFFVRFATTSQLEEFVARSRLGKYVNGSVATPVNTVDEKLTLEGYAVGAVWNQLTGFFDRVAEAPATGLIRYERTEGNASHVFSSRLAGMPETRVRSPSLAILAHISRMSVSAMFVRRNALVAKAPRLFLPSSWARWLAAKVSCNPAPVQIDGRWDYLYPVDEASLRALSILLKIDHATMNSTSIWVPYFGTSRSRRDRSVFDAKSGIAVANRVRNGAPT